MSMVPIPGKKNFFHDTVNNIVYERMENGVFNPVSIGGAARVNPDLISGERQLLDILGVSQCRATFQAARTTTDVPIGPTGGAEGDEMVQASLVAAPTTANLTITDGDGNVVVTFLTTDPIGTVKDVRAVASGGGFKIPLHASGVGTVNCVGDFT